MLNVPILKMEEFTNVVEVNQREEFNNIVESNQCQREEFNKQLNDVIASKNKNNVYMSKNIYEQILMEVINAKQKEHFKTPLDYRRLQRFDILNIGKEKRLIFPVGNSNGNTSVKYFVPTEELFDIIHNAHLSIGHGGRNRLIKELSNKYKNVTTEAIMLYLSLCTACQQKSKGKKKGIVIKPIISSELNSRCQVDLIDLQTQPDNEFKFILNYQDHLTKFVILRPLKTKTALEVTENLLDIFTILGAPSILHSDNGREFVNKIIMELADLWDGIKIVHGKPRHSQSQGSIERANQDVQNMLSTWLITNKTTKWSTGLKFIQLMKNRAYHDGIKQTPYEALFGVKMKLGLKTSFLPEDIITEVYSEEDLAYLILEENPSTIPKETEAAIQLTTSENLYTFSENVENLDIQLCCTTKFVPGVMDPALETLFSSSEEPENNVSILDKKKSVIKENRIAAKENLKIQATKMCNISNLKFLPAKVGECVKLPIPDVDRGKTDPRNLLCVVMKVIDEKYYKLGTKFGQLKQYYTRNQFSVCKQKLLSIDEVPNVEKAVREVISKESLTGGQGFKKCNCRGKCESRKCNCKSANVLCNSKCHGSTPCCNKNVQ